MLKTGTLICFYIYARFDFEFTLKCYIFSLKFYFSQNVKQILQESFFSTFVSSMRVNLNHHRVTAGVFNNCNIAICNFCSIWYSSSFRNCSPFIFFIAVFICVSILSIYFPRVFEVSIFKLIKSKVLHNSRMLESCFIHQYIKTIR